MYKKTRVAEYDSAQKLKVAVTFQVVMVTGELADVQTADCQFVD